MRLRELAGGGDTPAPTGAGQAAAHFDQLFGDLRLNAVCIRRDRPILGAADDAGSGRYLEQPYARAVPVVGVGLDGAIANDALALFGSPELSRKLLSAPS